MRDTSPSETVKRKARYYDYTERIFTACGGGIFLSSFADVVGFGGTIEIVCAAIGVLIGYYVSKRTEE